MLSCDGVHLLELPSAGVYLGAVLDGLPAIQETNRARSKGLSSGCGHAIHPRDPLLPITHNTIILTAQRNTSTRQEIIKIRQEK